MAFSLPLDKYVRNYDILSYYKELMTVGLQHLTELSDSEIMTIVDDIVAKGDYDRFVCEFAFRGKNGDRTMKKCTLLEYINNVERQGYLMSPTMTTYLPHTTKASLIPKIIEEDQGRRSKAKGIAKKAEGKNPILYQIQNGIQNTIKIFVNSWSGASKSPGNPFFCPSLHPTLSATCRISTALASAVMERLLAGMRFYHTPERVIEDILNICNTMSKDAVYNVVAKYGLVYPSVDDVMHIIERSTSYYWKDEERMSFIRQMVGSLSQEERAMFAYSGDFYNMFKLNDAPMREFVTKTISKQEALEQTEEGVAFLKKLDEDKTNLISALFGQELKGTSIKELGMANQDFANRAAAMSYNILKLYDQEYLDLVELFLRPTAMPIDVARQYEAIRLAIVLGDTDSSVCTTHHVCTLYYGEQSFSEEQGPVNAMMIFIANGMITHTLGQFTAQCNIAPEHRHLMGMKNEFNIPGLQITPVAKTYHGHVTMREGVVQSKPKWELKGQRFHANRSNVRLTKELHAWMKRTKIALAQGEKLDRGELIDMILAVEWDLKDSLSRKTDQYFTKVKVRPKALYPRPYSAEWAPHRLFEIMFGDTHGPIPDPEYVAFKCNIEYPEGVEKWVASLPPKYQQRYQQWCDEVGKTTKTPLTYFLVPVDCMALHGIPDIMKPIVDIRRLAKTALDAHYLNLASLGIDLHYNTDGNKRWLLLSDIMEE